MHERAWAEWFAIISAGLYLPVEIYEFLRTQCSPGPGVSRQSGDCPVSRLAACGQSPQEGGGGSGLSEAGLPGRERSKS